MLRYFRIHKRACRKNRRTQREGAKTYQRNRSVSLKPDNIIHVFSYKHRVLSLASGQEQDFVDYIDSRDYYRNEFIEYSLNNDEKSTFEKFKEVDKQIVPCGDIRRKMLKKCFRTIVESVMPEGMRFNMYLTVNSNPDCNQEYRKLFEQPHATASANIKSPIFYQGDRIYFELGIDPEMKELVSSKKDVMKKLHSDMTLIIHDLISVRNRLFKTLDDINLFSFAKNPEKFRSKDFGKLLKHSKIVEHDKDFSIFEIWNIKRKKAEDKCYDEICLTDENIDEEHA